MAQGHSRLLKTGCSGESAKAQAQHRISCRAFLLLPVRIESMWASIYSDISAKQAKDAFYTCELPKEAQFSLNALLFYKPCFF